MDWFERVEQAIEDAQTIADIEYIEDKIVNSEKRQNYRLKKNREKRDYLLNECHIKALILINQGAQPF